MGSLYLELNRPDEALLNHLRALQIYEDKLGQYDPNTATSLNNLATTYGALNQLEKAIPIYQRALSINQIAYGPKHLSSALSLSNLAWGYARLGKNESALVLLKAAVNIYQTQRETVSRIGKIELSSYTGKLVNTYQDLANLLIEQGRLPEAQQVLELLKEDEYFDFVRRSADAVVRKSRVGYTPTEQRWMLRYNQISQHLSSLGVEHQALEKRAKLGLTEIEQKRKLELRDDMQIAQTAFNAFMTELRTEFAQKGPARAIEVSEISQQKLHEMQSLLKSLSNDVVLVQYFATERRVNMLVTTPTVQIARTFDMPVKELNRKIAEYRRVLRNPKIDPLPLAQELYRILIAPVSQDLEQAGANTVMLYLDGALRYLPFSALHDGQHYLVERYRLPIYTEVAKDKLRQSVATQWSVGGLGVTNKIGEFAALPSVREELGGIVRSNSQSTAALPGEIYLNEQFTEARFRSLSRSDFPVLHIASHFVFSPGTEVNSFLLLGDGRQLTLGELRTQDWRFTNVDLLTLSACDTGLGGGRDENGREIEGFGVLAQRLGAKAVLATLWPVADQSTAQLMENMYRQRQQGGLTKAEALRQAQLALLNTTGTAKLYNHPFYWAPFILMGNWL